MKKRIQSGISVLVLLGATVLCLLIFSSCKESKKSIIDKFNKSENINHTLIKLADDSYFSKVCKIYAMDNKLIAYDIDNTFLFSITDLDKKIMLAKFGKLGQGPEEILGMVTTTSMIDKNSISFFEPNKSILYSINYEDLANTILVFDWDGNAIKIFNLDTEVSNIAITENDMHLYAYCNDKDQLIRFDLQ